MKSYFQLLSREYDRITETTLGIEATSKKATMLAKRSITALQRVKVTAEVEEAVVVAEVDKIVHSLNKDVEPLFAEVQAILHEAEAAKTAAVENDYDNDYDNEDENGGGRKRQRTMIRGHSSSRHRSKLTHCLQEFVEARLFASFIKWAVGVNDSSIALDAIDELNASLPPLVHVQPRDWLLGVCDVSGEAMRIATANQRPGDGANSIALRASEFLLLMYSSLAGSTTALNHWQDLQAKLKAMRQNIAKVEKIQKNARLLALETEALQ